MSQNSLQFKISSALKNIIGSDLINDDFIAIFELVKNSYDAHATKVEVIFEEIYTDKAKIIIKDNGKGMNYDDLINKWLFVAYSAKKEGTEEDSYDYRDQIKVKRAYAGAKGIGRFSCDRLGNLLYLESIKNEKNYKIETLLTDWGEFEGDIKDEFIEISVLHETIDSTNYDINNHGTVLEITELKSDWDRQKLLRLKDELAKLINPRKIEGNDEFTIELKVKDEINNDNKVLEYRSKVNGEIQNLIYKILDIKTAKIITKVLSEKEHLIETTLYEGGKLVYKIMEKNIYSLLHDIDYEVYYLNRSAKATFTRRMGMQPVKYGHVFLYKNGLRIYPYGSRAKDPFSMDNRKAQGYNRYIGTREILGYISISGENNELRETSSRGDGLIKTDTYFELVKLFYSSLRKLEKYNLEVTNWGNELSNNDFIMLTVMEKQKAIEKLISNLTKSKNIISFEVDPEIFEIIDKKQEKSAKNIISKIKNQLKAGNYDNEEIVDKLSKVEKDLEKLKQSTEEAEDEALDKLIKNDELTENLEQEIKKGAFKGALIGTDKERIIGLQHQIFHSSSRVNRNLKLLIKHLGVDNIDKKTQKYIKIISLETSKINSIAKFITKANFNLKATEIKSDLIQFIIDYVTEIYLISESVLDIDLNIQFIDLYKNNYIREFRPLEITTILDNLISNASKANAKNMLIKFSKNMNNLVINIQDDGTGISDKNIKEVFNMGYTTTNGSGIGLFQVHDLVTNSLKGEISISSIVNKNTTIEIMLHEIKI